MGIIKDLIFAGALFGLGYGTATVLHKDGIPDVRVLQKEHVLYYPMTPRELLKEYCVKVNADPKANLDIIDTAIDVNYELLIRAKSDFVQPEGIAVHPNPFALRTRVLPDTLVKEGTKVIVQRPYLENMVSGELKEIRQGEISGTLGDYTKEAGDGIISYTQKGLTGLKDKAQKIYDKITK
jgi:hypothetical protein